MSDYDYSDFRVISSILHGHSPNGKRVTIDFRLERYMIVLYAALHLPIFEQYKKRDGKNEGFTLYSLEGIANNLGYKFDRTKSSWKIYDNQEKEGKVRKKVIDKKTGVNHNPFSADIGKELLTDIARNICSAKLPATAARTTQILFRWIARSTTGRTGTAVTTGTANNNICGGTNKSENVENFGK